MELIGVIVELLLMVWGPQPDLRTAGVRSPTRSPPKDRSRRRSRTACLFTTSRGMQEDSAARESWPYQPSRETP